MNFSWQKILSFALAFIMVVGMFPGNVLAIGNDATEPQAGTAGATTSTSNETTEILDEADSRETIVWEDGKVINATTLSGNETITVQGTVKIAGTIRLNPGVISNITFNGEEGAKLIRAEGFTGQMFYCEGISGNFHNMTFNNITLDGGAVWTGEKDKTLDRGTTNEGIKSTGSMLYLLYTNVTLNKSVLQNHDDSTGEKANAVFLRYYSTITFNESVVRNNNSPSGYYSGGVITVRQGGTAKTYNSEVYGNSGTQGGFFGVSSTGSYGAVCEVYNSKFHNNFANEGAVFDMQCNSNKGYLLIDGCEFYKNASNRGLIYEHAYTRPVTIKDSYFHDNETALWDCHTDPILNLSGKIVIEEDPDYTGYLFETPIVLGGPLAEGSSIAMSEASIKKLQASGYLITGNAEYTVTAEDLAKVALADGKTLVLVDINGDGIADAVSGSSESADTEIALTLKDSMDGSTANATVYSDITCLPANPFKHAGYVFAGWVDANGNAVVKKNFTEAATLTATWKLENPVLKLSRENATLKVTVTNKYDGLTYTYQWYMDNVAIEGATSETYTMTDVNSHSYKCVVTVVREGMASVTGSASGTSSAPAAAQIGDVKYATLAEAIAAANATANATVTLLSNVTLGEKLTITGNVTISGAYTITRDTYTGTLFTVNSGATLTLDGGLVIDGGNEYVFDRDAFDADAANWNTPIAKEDSAKWFTPEVGAPVATAYMITTTGGTVNLNNVTIQNNYSVSSGIVSVGEGSTVTLTGAKITHVAATQGSGVVVNASGANINVTMNEGTVIDGNHVGGNHGIFKIYSGTVFTMNGGEITNNTGWNGNGIAVGVYWGTFYLKGGKICSNTGVYGPNNGRNSAIYLHSGHHFEMSGGTVCCNSGRARGGIDAPYDNGTTKISGGEVLDNISRGNGSTPDVLGTSVMEITGGTFTQNVSEWLAPNSGLSYNEQTGTYGIVTETLFRLHLIDPVTGEAAYVPYLEGNNLASLIAYGKLFYADYYKMELEILCDVKIADPVVIDYPMTINLNGKTITAASDFVNTPMFRILADVTVIGNGKIDGRPGDSCYAFIVGNADTAGDLTIENGTIMGGVSAVSVTKGTLTINGGNFAADPYEGSYEYTLNCIDANYKDGSAKIVVNGGVFYKFNPANNAAEGANTNFCATDCVVEELIDGYFTARQRNYVAQVGETKYESITDAIAAAKAAGVAVTVLQTIVLTEDGELDLQGVRLNAASSIQNAPVFRILADITVVNAGIIDGRGPTAGEGGINCYAFIVGNSETAGTLTITSGTYRGVTTAISITNGTVNIYGGTFQTGHDNEGTDYGAQYLLNCMDAAYKNGTAKFNITGGNFIGFNPESNTAEGANTNFLSGNYKASQYEENKWRVAEANVLVTGIREDGTPYNGDLYFASIYDALDFIQPRDTATIKLLSNVTITADQRMFTNYSIVINAEYITLDLNGKTMLFDYEGSTATCYASFAIYNKGTLTIIDSSAEKTGTIYNKTKIQGADGPRIIWVTSAGTAIIEGGNFISEQGDTMFYTSNSNAEIPTCLYIKGGYFEHKIPTNGTEYRYVNQQNGYQKQIIEISGGIFAHDFRDGELSVDPDYAPSLRPDGTWGVAESVASVIKSDGNNRYHWNFATLEEAIAAAQAGDTVKLLKDIELAASVTISNELILDLNGYSIRFSANSGSAAINLAGTLTLMDSSEDKTGKIIRESETDCSAIAIANGNLIVESGTIVSSHKGIQAGGTNKTNTITINGGVIQGATVALNLNKGNNTVSIAGGKLIGGNAIHASSNVTIVAFTISGGVFEGNLRDIPEGKLSITGGTFTVDPSAYVADGYSAVANTTGTWTVKDVVNVTITVENVTMVAGNAIPTLNATVTGVIDGKPLNYTLSVETDGKTAGTFDIIVTVEENPYYEVTVVAGTLEVLECVLTVNGIGFNSWADAKATMDANVGNGKTCDIVFYANINTVGLNAGFGANGKINIDLNGHIWTFDRASAYYNTVVTVSNSSDRQAAMIGTDRDYNFGMNSKTVLNLVGDIVFDATIQMSYNSASTYVGYFQVNGENIIGEDNSIFLADDSTVRISLSKKFMIINLIYGHLTLTENLATLSGQKITIGSGTSITIPQNVVLDLNAETAVTINGIVKGEGTIKVATQSHLDMVLTKTQITNIAIAEGIVIDNYTLNRADVYYTGATNLIGTDVVITAGTFDANVYDNCAYGYYAKDNGNGTWMVLPKIGIGRVEVNGNFVYNGTVQTPAITVYDVNGNVVASDYYTVDGDKFTNAGTYELTVTADGNIPYMGSATAEWSIAKKDATITANDKTMVAGNTVPTLDATVVGTVNGETLNYTLSVNTDGKTAGAFGIIVTLGENPNYNVTFDNATLRVESCIVTVDGIGYNSWEIAKTNIKKNSQIKLYANVEGAAKVETKFPQNGGNIVINLNGFDLTFHHTVTVQFGTVLTVMDDSGDPGKLVNTSASNPVVINAKATLNLTNGVVFDGMMQFQNLNNGPAYFQIDGENIIGTDKSVFQTDATVVRVFIKDQYMNLKLSIGSLILTEDLETLADHKITIDAGTSITIPKNVVLNLNAETAVTIKGVVKGEGTIVVNAAEHLTQVLAEIAVANIRLGADITTDTDIKMMNSGVTLDLNGKKLTANGLLAWSGNHVVDKSTDKQGILAIPKNKITLQMDNAQMPVYIAEKGGYAFATMNLQTRVDSQTDNSFELTFRPSFGAALNSYFADGAADNDIEIIIRVTWTSADGETKTKDFCYTEDFIQFVYSDKNSFTFKLTGISGLENVQISMVVRSLKFGIEASTGDLYTYTAPEVESTPESE